MDRMSDGPILSVNIMTIKRTRMHSSRMHTTCFSGHLGVCVWGGGSAHGMSAQWGVCPGVSAGGWGCLPGGCLPKRVWCVCTGGLCPGVCVSARRCLQVSGVSTQGGVHPYAHCLLGYTRSLRTE